MEKSKKILRLNELPKEKRIMVEQMLTKNPMLKRPTSDFNEWGLRFPIDYLNEIGGTVVLLPLEYMAEYVDVVTKSEIDANEVDFIRAIINQEDCDLSLYNATSIGNLAYVALNCKDITAQEVAMEILENYADFYYEKLAKVINQNKVDKSVN